MGSGWTQGLGFRGPATKNDTLLDHMGAKIVSHVKIVYIAYVLVFWTCMCACFCP